MRNRSVTISQLSIVSLILISACTTANPFRRNSPTPSIPIDLPVLTQGQLRDFDLTVKSIQSQYISQKAAVAWQAQTSEYRIHVSSGLNNSAFIETLSSLLGIMNDRDLSVVGAVIPAAITTTSSVTSSFTGIGVIAGLPSEGHDRVLIMHVIPSSPAEEAGLKQHDAIVQIDGKAVIADEGTSVLSRLRGPAGSKVTLTIHTPGTSDRIVEVTRRAILSQSAFTSNRVSGTNIGYISPDDSSVDGMRVEISQALRDLSTSQAIDALILDLRLIQSPDFPVTDMLELFANGNAGSIQTRSGKAKIEITGKNIAGSQELPLVVLVSDQTRGVAESFAGMLQDLGRARIAGSPTTGRLAVISAVSLPNTGSVLLIPSGEYRGIKDQSWYGSGIRPDIPSDLKWEEFTTEDDPQLKQAVQALTRP